MQQLIKPELRIDVPAKAIDFIWPDYQVRFTYQRLREICPCAFCRSKRMKNQALVEDESIQNTYNVDVTELNHQGYGVQICFSDGHDKGLYPWVYLKNAQAHS